MIYLYSFLFAGTICLIGQVILDNTKLTPGHITSLFVVIGASLDIFNIYEDKFAESRRRLGRLYKMRADRLRNNGKVEKAIHNYKEAIKLLPKTDKLFYEAFNEMKKLRVQVTAPEK